MGCWCAIGIGISAVRWLKATSILSWALVAGWTGMYATSYAALREAAPAFARRLGSEAARRGAMDLVTLARTADAITAWTIRLTRAPPDRRTRQPSVRR